MAYCPRCGVETQENICPLCKTTIPEWQDLPWAAPTWPKDTQNDPSKVFATNSQRKTQIFLFITCLILLPTVILLAIDFYQDANLSWSSIPVFSLAAAFCYILLAFYHYNSFLRISLGTLTTTGLYLLAMDQADGPKAWFLPLGLPILMALAIALVVGYFIILKSQRKGYNVFGVVLTTIAGFCLTMDSLLSLYILDRFLFSWSILVASATLPLALYFFYLHYGLKKNLNLRRTFHF